MILKSKKPIYETIAFLSIYKNMVNITFKESNDDFKNLIKSYGFRWGYDLRCWYRKASIFTESLKDILVEISLHLLASGFVISVDEICNNLGMEAEELIRLKQQLGIAHAFKNHEYSRTWTDEK